MINTETFSLFQPFPLFTTDTTESHKTLKYGGIKKKNLLHKITSSTKFIIPKRYEKAFSNCKL